jgi:hypothetical protein
MRNLRDDLSIAVLADQDGDPLIAMLPQDRQHVPVPQREKHGHAFRPLARGMLASDNVHPPCPRESAQ